MKLCLAPVGWKVVVDVDSQTTGANAIDGNRATIKRNSRADYGAIHAQAQQWSAALRRPALLGRLDYAFLARRADPALLCLGRNRRLRLGRLLGVGGGPRFFCAAPMRCRAAALRTGQVDDASGRTTGGYSSRNNLTRSIPITPSPGNPRPPSSPLSLRPGIHMPFS